MLGGIDVSDPKGNLVESALAAAARWAAAVPRHEARLARAVAANAPEEKLERLRATLDRVRRYAAGAPIRVEAAHLKAERAPFERQAEQRRQAQKQSIVSEADRAIIIAGETKRREAERLAKIPAKKLKKISLPGMLNTLAVAESKSPSKGTGATILKMGHAPMAKLIEARKIGPDELQAAGDICEAYFALCGGMMFKPQSLERRDPGHGAPEPARTVDAIRRYRNWADHWSMRAKQGDKTLEIVISAVIDERPFRTIEGDVGVRHGLAQKAVIRGLRDYAARAGWCDKRQAAQWKAEAGNSFPIGRRILAVAVAKAKKV